MTQGGGEGLGRERQGAWALGQLLGSASSLCQERRGEEAEAELGEKIHPISRSAGICLSVPKHL